MMSSTDVGDPLRRIRHLPEVFYGQETFGMSTSPSGVLEEVFKDYRLLRGLFGILQILDRKIEGGLLWIGDFQEVNLGSKFLGGILFLDHVLEDLEKLQEISKDTLRIKNLYEDFYGQEAFGGVLGKDDFKEAFINRGREGLLEQTLMRPSRNYINTGQEQKTL